MKKIFTGALVLLACGLFLFAAAAQGGDAAVRITNHEFRPPQLEVRPGAVVTWTNEAGSHTVTADDDSFASPTLGAKQTFSRRFDKPGTYGYYCAFHGGKGGEGMSGTVTVK